ncbi:DUF6265 family protein [Massilia sp. W12]|uniref:DUF6265 family protein n=1 Tax=Massilia sp. W12 TaxID=3126507 RepID=UPI0030CC0648
MRAWMGLLFFAAAAAGAQEAPPVAREQAWRDAAWLSGCWRQEGREDGSYEYWMPPAGGSMLGMARTVRQGKTVEYEFMRIHQDEKGRLVFTAQPSGQPAASFVQSGSGPELVFENPQHDFPQKISYQAQPGDKLLARISGVRNGKPRSMEFPMQRIACPGAR